MITKRINRKLSVNTSVVVITATCVIAGAVEIQALRAKDLRDHPASVQNGAECIRCHADEKTIDQMRRKEDGAHFLFNSDGSFKDSTLAGSTGNYRHAAPVRGLQKAK
jgi:hypothetical protein